MYPVRDYPVVKLVEELGIFIGTGPKADHPHRAIIPSKVTN
jgi:hypothetical protein